MTESLDLAKVKKAIARSGLQKKAVAKAIGVRPESFSAFLGGKRNLGKSAQILLLQVLNLNEADVLKRAS